MTLLRRAPREVYRLYGEDEFLSCADAGGRSEATTDSFEVHVPAAGRRALQRILGTTMLLATAGALGGLIALTTMPSAPRARRRATTGRLAGAGSFSSSRPVGLNARPRPASADVQPGVQARARTPVAVRAVSLGRGRRSPRAVRREVVDVAAARRIGIRTVAELPPSPSSDRVSAPQQPGGRAEFGFER